MKKILPILLLFVALISNAQSVSIASSVNGTICAGTSVTFTATTSGITSPTYQWYKNGTAISGATNSTYTTTSLSNTDQIKVICNNPPSIVNDNSLQLWLDAGNSASYSTGITWSDLSGNGRNATLNNGASFDATSKSIVTNGVDQYVSVPLFNSSITNTTMQTWVYINANSKGAFMSNGTSSYSIGIGSSVSGEMSNNGNRAWMLFSSVRYIDTNTDYPSGWHLVTMTMDANAKPSYYLDGSFVYTSSSGSNPNTVSDSFNLGAVPGDGGKYYNGKFAAAYFYNRVLTASEISQNYNATVGSIGGGSGGGVTSNTITVSVSPVPTSNITVSGDACINKTSLSITSGVYTYTWMKDNVTIPGATSNTYLPTAAGDYKVAVSNGTCSSTSSATTIYTCGVTADGKMRPTSSVTTLLSNEGGINFGTGTNETGSIFNTTGLTTFTGTISTTTAIIGGVISATNAVTSSIGVIYSADINFGTYSSTTIQSNVVAGTYTATISGLSSSTPYFVKSFIVNKSGTIYGEALSFTTTTPPVTLGSLYRGGFVFYIFQSTDAGYVSGETHGLIAETQDQTTNSPTNPDYDNTNWCTWNNALSLIANSNNHSTAGKLYTDWRFPTMEELNKLYSQVFTVPALSTFKSTFNRNFYWSSTSSSTNSNQACVTGFGGGGVNFCDGDKATAKLPIRSIRSF